MEKWHHSLFKRVIVWLTNINSLGEVTQPVKVRQRSPAGLVCAKKRRKRGKPLCFFMLHAGKERRKYIIWKKHRSPPSNTYKHTHTQPSGSLPLLYFYLICHSILHLLPVSPHPHLSLYYPPPPPPTFTSSFIPSCSTTTNPPPPAHSPHLIHPFVSPPLLFPFLSSFNSQCCK